MTGRTSGALSPDTVATPDGPVGRKDIDATHRVMPYINQNLSKRTDRGEGYGASGLGGSLSNRYPISAQRTSLAEWRFSTIFRLKNGSICEIFSGWL
ncbi:hypothetical protein A8E25_09765 [Burkholderia cenocepacia]|nr:hypothetical protein BURCENK562V_C3147 [Burkholderia cenocepacia K56-2Valvano]ERI31487.1 hypothetical protein BURCENBC7_AP3179 [Burkholderia cenocepacia BC7]MCO2667099.1 hypothetical protein [Pseudomonas aeruginosa]ONR50536.1 hypothetical protein A8E17_33690 [Burkholderia cenocepacia]ONR65143.1 hypothetical protein A8E18_27710 [Burkholderia cenocepacia]